MLTSAYKYWTINQIIQMIKDGEITFENAVQRGLVWDNDRKSLLMHSAAAGFPIPDCYAARTAEGYDMLDGKQRMNAFADFIEDKFELTNVPCVLMVTKDGQIEVVEVEGKKFSELPKKIQTRITDMVLNVKYFEDITDDEICDMFYRLNNGKPLTGMELSWATAKDMRGILEIAGHDLFKIALSDKMLIKKTNRDVAYKMYIMLTEKSPDLDGKKLKLEIKHKKLTKEGKERMKEVCDRILAAYNLIEDKKIKKRIIGRTHMISITPIIWKSLQDGRSDKETAEFLAYFFSGTTRASKSNAYNACTGAGSSTKKSVETRLNELTKYYNKHFDPKSYVSGTV